MFTVTEKTDTYNRRGDVVATTERAVFTSEDLTETMKWRYANSKNGFNVLYTEFNNVALHTDDADGNRLDFADMFLLLEGQVAFDAVMDGTMPAQVEAHYVAELA